MAQFITTHWWAMILFGVGVGVFAGLTGTGGGIVLVPIFVLLFGLTQQAAQGTSLAMILSPVSIPAILRYHGSGAIRWDFVAFVAPGMFLGSYFGARLATMLPQQVLRMVFAFVLIYVASYMIFSQGPSIGRALVLSLVPLAVGVGLALATGVFAEVAEKEKAKLATPPASAAEESEEPTTQQLD